jgi:hypothetical protein
MWDRPDGGVIDAQLPGAGYQMVGHDLFPGESGSGTAGAPRSSSVS